MDEYLDKGTEKNRPIGPRKVYAMPKAKKPVGRLHIEYDSSGTQYGNVNKKTVSVYPNDEKGRAGHLSSATRKTLSNSP